MSAIGGRDFPVIQTVVLIAAAGFAITNLLVDLLYTTLDPRIQVSVTNALSENDSRFRSSSACCCLIVLFGATLGANVITQRDPNKTSLISRLKPPLGFGGTAQSPLGTDALGRDILSRLLHGGQVSIAIAGISTVIGLLFGVGLGVLAGYLRGPVDQVVMYLVDVQLSLPFILLAIVAAIALGNTITVLIGLAALGTWPYYARLVRADVLSLRERDFVLAARAIGAGDLHIMRQHLLPKSGCARVGRRDVKRRACDFAGKRPVVPRHRDQSARCVLGQHDRRRPRIPCERVVAGRRAERRACAADRRHWHDWRLAA